MKVQRTGIVVARLVLIIEVNQRRARLVPGWLTVSVFNSRYTGAVSVCNHPRQNASTYRVAEELDDRRGVEVVERFQITRSVDVAFGRVDVWNGVHCGRVVVVFAVVSYQPRNEQWTHQTHQYLTAAHTHCHSCSSVRFIVPPNTL